MKKNILITGATGFLGRHLIKALKEKAYHLFEIYISNTKKANLMDYNNLVCYNGIKFDYIFHLAAITKAGDYCLYHKADQFYNNQIINTNILRYWHEHQPQATMVAMGTSCSYAPDLPMTEENYLVGQPDAGLYVYAMTKRMLLVGLQAYAQQYGLKYKYFIPSTLYGPDFDLNDNHFIFDLIRKIHEGSEYGNPVELWGDGYQKRELIYIDDAVNQILYKTFQNDENCIINIGSGKSYPIREYAQIICDYYDFEHKFIFYNKNKYVGALDKQLVIKPENKVQLTSLETGLYTTMDYFVKQVSEK